MVHQTIWSFKLSTRRVPSGGLPLAKDVDKMDSSSDTNHLWMTLAYVIKKKNFFFPLKNKAQ